MCVVYDVQEILEGHPAASAVGVEGGMQGLPEEAESEPSQEEWVEGSSIKNGEQGIVDRGTTSKKVRNMQAHEMLQGILYLW